MKFAKIPINVGVIVFTAFLIVPILSSPAQAQDGRHNTDIKNELVDLSPYEEYNVRMIPSSLVKMDTNNNPYVLIVDKEKQELYVYKFDGNYHKIKTYECTTGSIPGNKQKNGDLKTPEGVYFFTQVLDSEQLVRLYGKGEALQFGIRAFDMDYPNGIDRIYKKKGYDIWLHATDRPDRIGQPYDTKGCVAINNRDMEEITSLISLNKTPIIISKEIEYVTSNQLESYSKRILNFIENWKISWEQRNFEEYESSYSPNFMSDDKNLHLWIDYKKQVLNQYKWIDVDISNMRIYQSDEYIVVEYHQSFRSGIYRDEGTKRLYIVENEGRLLIISESWTDAN